MRLRIESVNGTPINDYRLHEGRIEVRLLDPIGRAYKAGQSRWRVLDANDIQLHHALGTVVSKWLHGRLGSEAATALQEEGMLTGEEEKAA